MKVRRHSYTTDGVKHETQKFYIVFTDNRGERHQLPAFGDKKNSQALARTLARYLGATSTGEPPPPDLAAWPAKLERTIRKTLVKWGIITGRAAGLPASLSEHLDAWQAFLVGKENSPRDLKQKVARARRVLEGCGFLTIADIAAAPVLEYLKGLRDDPHAGRSGYDGISAQTFNHYRQAVKQFCRWLCRNGHAAANPLEYLPGLNVRTDRRHDRRALDVQEIHQLLRTTAAGPTLAKLTGPTRTLLYRLALETGLRANELASLTPSSFHLDADPPTVTVAAGYSKHRREDVLFLKRTTAAALRPELAALQPGERIFGMRTAERKRLAEVIAKDLAAARAAWLADAPSPAERERREETDFLLFRDSADRFADFHALRHTFGSLLGAAGTRAKVTQTVMRHSDPKLTARYTHLYDGDEAAAVESLPDLSPPDTRDAQDQPPARKASPAG